MLSVYHYDIPVPVPLAEILHHQRQVFRGAYLLPLLEIEQEGDETVGQVLYVYSLEWFLGVAVVDE